MSSNRATWKAAERRVARELGGQRVPVTGRARGDAPDVRHPVFSVEVKHRRQLPAWLHRAMQQAIAAQGNGQLGPLVVLHEAGQRFAGAYAVLRLADLVTLLDERAADRPRRQEDEKQ